jgi:hypothetical protein
MSDSPFLHRWSKRKHAANRGDAPAEPAPAPAAAPPVTADSRAPAPVTETPSLPDVASLTPESDFTPFMREGVPDGLKRQALKTLFEDPRFNVMDGLDVYIDDYSKPDPLPEGWLEKMNQVARLGDYREPEPDPAEGSETAKPLPADTRAPVEIGTEVPESGGEISPVHGVDCLGDKAPPERGENSPNGEK